MCWGQELLLPSVGASGGLSSVWPETSEWTQVGSAPSPLALVSIATTFALLDLMLEELFLRGCWGSLGSCQSQGFSVCSHLPFQDSSNEQGTCKGHRRLSLWQEERWSSPVQLPQRYYIVSKAVINFDCEISQYLMFICVKSTIAKQQVPFDLSPGKKASLENKYTVKQSAHWREIQQCNLTEMWLQTPSITNIKPSVRLISSLTFLPWVHRFLSH